MIFKWLQEINLIETFLKHQVKYFRSHHATNSTSAVKEAREASLQVKGARLFNLMPLNLRNMTGVSVEVFKTALDTLLGSIPENRWKADGWQIHKLMN